MNQKQIKRNRNLNHKAKKYNTRINDNINYEGCSRRPILYSSDDVERMAVESSRARLMMQLVSPEEPSEKTDSSFCKGNIIPTYMLTSQTEMPVPRRNYPTYPPLVQGLRWSPSIENTQTYSEDSQTDDGEDRQMKCKCHRCEMRNCLAQKNVEKNCNSYRFKDNIARFCDNSTMTRNLRESGCGVRTPLPRANTSEVSISTSDAVKDVLRIQTYPNNPETILKKPELVTNPNFGKKTKHNILVNLEDTMHTHTCSDYENLLKSYAEKSMVLAPSNKNNKDTTKAIYNERFSNSIANNTLPNVPLKTKQIMSQIKFEYSNSNRLQRTSRHLGGKQSIIPYTHRKNSKYHYDCKEPKKRNRKVQEDPNYLEIGPVPMKPDKLDYMPSIRLPRRVLTSERNIEAFMDKRPIKLSSALKS